MIYVFAASKYSYCKLIKQSNQPIHTFFSHFCTYLFYIEGNGKEGKVHEDLILSKMAETFVIHIVFHLSEHGLSLIHIWVYDPAEGDPEGGIAPGTAFEDIPDDWVCPLCGVGKDDFEVQED